MLYYLEFINPYDKNHSCIDCELVKLDHLIGIWHTVPINF